MYSYASQQKTQLVAVGGCGQDSYNYFIIAHMLSIVNDCRAEPEDFHPVSPCASRVAVGETHLNEWLCHAQLWGLGYSEISREASALLSRLIEDCLSPTVAPVGASSADDQESSERASLRKRGVPQGFRFLLRQKEVVAFASFPEKRKEGIISLFKNKEKKEFLQ